MYRPELIEAIAREAAEWRRELHRNPQTMYEEEFVSAFVAGKLTEWGIPHERGIAKTGVVATIEGCRNDSGRAVAFRADMDALPIEEASGQPWASLNPGRMHACGHDGHTATLLTLARYLQLTRRFDGTVRLVFQPAEEGGRGAFRMLEEGLLERFPFDEIYGYHNWPNAKRGTFLIRSGPVMASVDDFLIELTGAGGHAAFPENAVDALPAAARLVVEFAERGVAPGETAVLAVTNFRAGTGAHNVISGVATLSGTVRTFANETRDRIEARMRELTRSVAEACRVEARLDYKRLIDPVVNHDDQTEYCRQAAESLTGTDSLGDFAPVMGGEDFGGFLEARPGAFVAIGQGENTEGSPHNFGLHSPRYDFNDAILPIAAKYFAELAERRLPAD